MASCYEAVTQQASEMQANVNKIDAKSATLFSVEDNESLDDEIFAIELSLEDEPEVKLTIGGQEVDMLIDSGASCHVIDHQLWKQLQLNGIKCGSQSENRSIWSYATASKVQVEAKFWSKLRWTQKSNQEV
ncbi:unnamed protein product, partial [Pocillopora meandrina]